MKIGNEDSDDEEEEENEIVFFFRFRLLKNFSKGIENISIY